MHVKTMWSVAQSAMWDWWNDNCIRLSASLAFYTALSLAPLVIIVVSTAGLITERQLVADQLEQQIELLMGSPSRQLVHTILATTEPQSGTLAAMIGFVTLDVCFINSSPVELPYACTVEGDRRHVQNVGAGG